MTNAPEMLEYRVVNTGGFCQELYLLEGKCHRNDGPAAVVRDEQGRLIAEFWCQRGELHRSAGPAAIYYNCDHGGVEEERYFADGQLWREDGPAVIRYRVNGKSIQSASWWREGEQLPMTLTRWLWLTGTGESPGEPAAEPAGEPGPAAPKTR